MSTQPGHPFVGRCNEYQLCGWGVKADKVNESVAGKNL